MYYQFVKPFPSIYVFIANSEEIFILASDQLDPLFG